MFGVVLPGTKRNKKHNRCYCWKKIQVNCRGGHVPGWVHSFAATDKYIIIPEMPLRYSLDCIFGGNVFKWQPETKAFMHVVSRHTGRTVSGIACFLP